ncbi:MAG: hypothetical protein JWQ99_4028 [Blastococcus sp.]|nr:hypothetical protein [Blastococcus sp.]
MGVLTSSDAAAAGDLPGGGLDPAVSPLEGAVLPERGAVLRLRQARGVVSALPLFLTAPLLRSWHLRWGSTPEEAAGPMPGDDLVPVAHFSATRAITINAVPERVWPWLVQVGAGRGGFYSYDLLDALGRPSAEQVLPEWQDVHIGDVAAPMTQHPGPTTSFVVDAFRSPEHLVWAKQDSSWAWKLTPLPGGRTRLVTRVKQHYPRRLASVVGVILLEFGDFPMMRQMLRGIRRRAESVAR